jgi:pilus assembly protein CpaB
MAVSAPVRRPAAPKQAGRRTLFWIGIGMSVLAFLLVIVLGTVVAGRATLGTAKVGVVVAARDINHRDVITASDVTIASLPVTAVPPGALLVQSEATGKVAQISVLKGQPITTNLFAASGAGDPAYLPIPQGWVAYTLAAGELKGVGGYVAPGDVIDIEATVIEDPSTGISLPPTHSPVTKLIFQAVHVIRVGPGSETSRNGQALGVATTITVLMTTCDAPYLTWLEGRASLTYTLRSAKDYGAAPAGPAASCPLSVAPAPAPPRVDWTATDKKFGFTKG